MTIPLVFGLILAFANGGVVPNPAVVDIAQGGGGTAGTNSTCTDAQGRDVLCCAWQPDGWAMGYMAWASLMIGWSTLLAFTLKVGFCAGCTYCGAFLGGGGSGPASSLSAPLGLRGSGYKVQFCGQTHLLEGGCVLFVGVTG